MEYRECQQNQCRQHRQTNKIYEMNIWWCDSWILQNRSSRTTDISFTLFRPTLSLFNLSSLVWHDSGTELQVANSFTVVNLLPSSHITDLIWKASEPRVWRLETCLYRYSLSLAFSLPVKLAGSRRWTWRSSDHPVSKYRFIILPNIKEAHSDCQGDQF
jgi:hypothetical protein